MPDEPSPQPSGGPPAWPPTQDRPNLAGTKARVVSAGSLKDRIAKFNDLSAGSAPLLPNAPFGIGAPPSHAQSQARGGLVGNRIPSLDPKSQGFLGVGSGVPGILKKATEVTSRSPSASAPLKGATRSDSPGGSLSSSAASVEPDNRTSGSPATSRSASPAAAPAEARNQFLSSTLPEAGNGSSTPSSTLAEASGSTSSLLSESQFDLPNSLSRKNLHLSTGETPAMARQDSSSSAPVSVAAASASSVQAQYEPSSTGSGDAAKMMQDVSGVSTPVGTPRAAQRDLSPELEDGPAEGGKAVSDTAKTDESGSGAAEPVRLRQQGALLAAEADVEDIVVVAPAGPPVHAEDIEVEGAAGSAGEVVFASAQQSLAVAEGSQDTQAAVTPGQVKGPDSSESPSDPHEIVKPSASAAHTALVASDTQGDRLGTAASASSLDDKDVGLPTAKASSTPSSESVLPISVEMAQEGSESAAVDGPVSVKPRARLGPMEVVYLPDSDSEDEDNAAEQGDGGEKQEGDFLSEHPDDTEDLHLRHMRLTTEALIPLRFSRFGAHLRRLCLRQNAITSPLPADLLDGLPALEELDLYDNRLGPEFTNGEVHGCSNIKTLDLSFNNLRKAPNLPDLQQVETLYLVQNKIKAVEAGDFDWCNHTMRSLELGGNRLRRLENLEKLTQLDELWLGKNKIRVLENLETFKNLKILSMQSNRITRIEGLEGLENLEELYFSHNGLTKLEGLEKNLKLRTLDVGNNQIAKIENISHLHALEEFWASYNSIPDLADLDRELAVLPALETVYLEGNPCQKSDMAGYRRKIMLALPNIKQIDATYVQAAPYTPKQQGSDVATTVSKISRAVQIEPEASTPLEDSKEARAAEANFPEPPSASPSGTPAVEQSESQTGSSTPLDPALVKSFPSLSHSGVIEDPSGPDANRVRVQVIVPPSPEKGQANSRSAGTVEASVTDGGARSPAQASSAPKSPLLDDEEPDNSEGGWATVTKGRGD